MIETPLQDSELWELVVSRDDQGAFRQIYQRYWKELFLTAYRKVQSKELAEEMTQNLFLRLWEKRREYQVQNLSAYLFGALKFSIIENYKSQVVRDKYLSYLHENKDDGVLNTEHAVLFGDLLDAVEKGMDTLPVKTRQVFRMSKMEHCSVKEIAQHLELSEKAVEYHITQSLKVIRGYLKNYLVIALLWMLA